MKLRGKQYVNLEELEEDAKPLLTENAYGYYSSGAETEWTMNENLLAFRRYRLLPRCLVDVSHIDTSCDILGHRLSMPVLVAPMAMQRLCHPDGELAMARGTSSAGSAMLVSTMATCGLEEVAAIDHAPPLLFQIYVLTDRHATAQMVKEAEASGYKGLVVTIDAPRIGRREVDERNKFFLSEGLSLKNLERITAAAGQTDAQGVDGSKFGKHFSKLVDDSLSWDIIPWLKSLSTLPIFIKGVLAPDDARKAVEMGVDGIIVSNHGGRQMDFVPSSIDLLPHIVAAVGGRVPVWVDGGVRRGTDVLKCLAMGANAVLIGRPMLWALTLGGEDGVKQALEALQAEIELGMALLGCRSVAEVTGDYLIMPSDALQLPESRR